MIKTRINTFHGSVVIETEKEVPLTLENKVDYVAWIKRIETIWPYKEIRRDLTKII